MCHFMFTAAVALLLHATTAYTDTAAMLHIATATTIIADEAIANCVTITANDIYHYNRRILCREPLL
jgi:hypothetical protein